MEEFEHWLPPDRSLVDANAGPLGVTVRRRIGDGGMANVYLAEFDGTKSEVLSPTTPTTFALKVMHENLVADFMQRGLDPLASVRREVLALQQATRDVPPPENVVGFFGFGSLASARNPKCLLPWLALEYVQGGPAGVTLQRRVLGAHDGFDPGRVAHIARQLFTGVQVLHREGVIHRDLKPENILMAGNIDDETLKIGDFGIARIEEHAREGVSFTINAMSEMYAAPEQFLAQLHPTARNPLIGPWTDVYAIAAIIWFTIAGEDWRLSASDPSWRTGLARRPLVTGERIHQGFRDQPEVLDAIDQALVAGIAHGLSSSVWERDVDDLYRSFAEPLGFKDSMWRAPFRYERIEQFAAHLLPLLERCREKWMASASAKQRAATALRPTLLLPNNIDAVVGTSSAIKIRGVTEILQTDGAQPVAPGNAAFQPDGKVLARFGRHVAFYIDERAILVAMPAEYHSDISSTQWVVRAPGGGFALVGPEAIVLIQHSNVRRLAMPSRSDGGVVGPIQAVVGTGTLLGVVTGEVDHRGGPELFQWTPSGTWNEPVILPLAGDANCVIATPYGFLCAGAHSSGRGRAALLDFNRQAISYVPWLTNCPPLRVAVGGTEREFWVAGGGRIYRLDRAGAEVECAGFGGEAVAMALDPVGAAWLVTQSSVLRRLVTRGKPVWRTYSTKSPSAPDYVAIGFTPRGADILDSRGIKHRIATPELSEWRSPRN
jgi:serine/threonine protein kinase